MLSQDLQQIAADLESENSKDRLLALAALRDVPAELAVPLIEKVLYDRNMPVRSMAIFSLGIKQTDACFPILIKLLESDPDYGIRADAAGALGYLEDPRALQPLVRAFYEDTDWLVRFSAAVALGNLKDLRAKAALLEALDSDRAILHQAAIAALGEIGAVDAIERLLDFVRSEDWLVRQRLAEALGNLPSPQSSSALRYLAKDPHPQVASAATLALQKLAG